MDALDRALRRALAMAQREGHRWPVLRDEFASLAGLIAWKAVRDGRPGNDPARYAAWKARRAFAGLIAARDRTAPLEAV